MKDRPTIEIVADLERAARMHPARPGDYAPDRDILIEAADRLRAFDAEKKRRVGLRRASDSAFKLPPVRHPRRKI